MTSEARELLRPALRLFVVALVTHLACMTGCTTTTSPNYRDQQVFATPESAAQALVAAAQRGDIGAIESIFGPSGRELLSSGDPQIDKQHRAVFANATREGWTLERTDSNTRELIVGNEEWPFPIPLVKDSHGWWFDTIAGADEVVARRIGRNELAVIGVCRAYVIAQREYASESRDGRPEGTYAQQVQSDPGKHNGLFWAKSGPGEEASPLGELAAQASAQGSSAPQDQQSRPFHGYYFRILTKQGEAAPGGAKDYVVKGEMTDGFALIAYPAEYGSSGMVTFLVNHEGHVLQNDLGEQTLSIAESTKAFNPDLSWIVAQ